jgi:hypothetical protein
MHMVNVSLLLNSFYRDMQVWSAQACNLRLSLILSPTFNGCRVRILLAFINFHHLSLCCVIVAGPGVPTINSLTGGFVGGVYSTYGFFNLRKYPARIVSNIESNYESDEEDEYDDSPPYSRNRYSPQRSRPYYTSKFDFSYYYFKKNFHSKLANLFYNRRSSEGVVSYKFHVFPSGIDRNTNRM